MRDDRHESPRDHARDLTVLAAMDPAALKAEAEALLPLLGGVEVLQSRTGLVLLPMRDTVQETDFHLGDVLVAEAHVRLPDHGAEGYGMVTGRDLERAMAMARLDAALSAGVATARIGALLDRAEAGLAAADALTLRRIGATRVDMETF